MKKYSGNLPCPCQSGSKYKKCCQKYHKGAIAPSALTLMKSRYSAYAVGNADYIMRTTHPQNSDYSNETSHWRAEIMQFCHTTLFHGLKILSVEDGVYEAFVTFEATLSTGMFKEKSRFLKENGQWLYVDGTFI